MACDYLAIQGSATLSECAFSWGGITGTASCNRLTPEAFEVLQILKSAYQNGHIVAAEDAAKHLDVSSNASELDISEVETVSDSCSHEV